MEVLDKRDETRPKRTVLRVPQVDRHVERNHFAPCARLAPYCAIAWTLSWDLEDSEELKLEVLPDPSIIMVVSTVEPPHVLGIVPGAFAVTLRGAGFVYGLKFRPGGFGAFLNGRPASGLTGTRIRLDEFLSTAALEQLVRRAGERDGLRIHEELASALDSLIPASIPEEIQLSLELCTRIAADPAIADVKTAARSVGLSVRAVQRLFQRYVGVGPKWMIRRCRIQEAAAKVESGTLEGQDWADLALSLGYCDQSHLIREFKRMTGYAPARYRRAI